MKQMIGGAAMLLALAACSDPDGAEDALSRAGYTDITITGYSFFGCDDKDAFHTGFTAIGPTGQQAEGVVCSGWFKGNTIRLD